MTSPAATNARTITGIAIAALLSTAACGDDSATPIDAPLGDGAIDGQIDALPIDAPEPGSLVFVVGRGIRAPNVVTFTPSSGPVQTVVVNDNRRFRFPRPVQPGTTFTTTVTGEQQCVPIANVTIGSENVDLDLTCDGILELASIAFPGEHVDVMPGFDPLKLSYATVTSRVLDATAPLAVVTSGFPDSVTPMISPASPTVSTAFDVVTSIAELPAHTYHFGVVPMLVEEAYLKPGTIAANDGFGGAYSSLFYQPETDAIDLDGNRLAVGATKGFVSIFERTGRTWALRATIPGTVGTRFGASVALDGDTLVIGAPAANANNGRVEIFVRTGPTTWVQQGAFDGSGTEHLGASVALAGDLAIAGAPAEAGGGLVRTFTRTGTTWSAGPIIDDANTAAGDAFGNAIALSSTTLVIGAPFEDGCAADASAPAKGNGCGSRGAAYVFVSSGGTWSEQAYLKPELVAAPNNFMAHGAAVDIAGDLIVVGAPRWNNGKGVAFAYARTGTTWTRDAQHFEDTAAGSAAGELGTSVAVFENHVAIGQRYERSAARGIDQTPTNDNNSFGAVRYYRRIGGAWDFGAALPHRPIYVKSQNLDALDQFGASVALGHDTIVVAAPTEASCSTSPADNGCTGAGAVYVYR